MIGQALQSMQAQMAAAIAALLALQDRQPLAFIAATGLLVLALVVTLLIARRRLGRRDAAIGDLREANATLRSQAERVAALEADLRQSGEALTEEKTRRAAADQQIATLTETHQARLEEIRGLRQELEDRFTNLAASVLNRNSEQFLGLVSERFKTHSQAAEQDLGKRQHAIAELVKPLDEKLAKFDQRMGEIEKARGEAYGAITAQVVELARGQQSLGAETRKLVQALRAPKTRGRWGEMQLRKVFEMAGMTEHVDFQLESTMEVDGARKRPDAIISIPGGKQIVVDAKTPLEAYLDALEATTPEAQTAQLLRHARQVREHVKLLSSKEYQSSLHSTPDFVVMFIPGETFVSAAAEADPGLIEFAFERKVLIATPTTLMALVKAIAYGWQQEKMAENAVEVQKSAKDIYDRLAVFAGHLSKVGRSLGQSVEHYNSAVGSLESRVLVSARRFETLGVVVDGSEITSPTRVELDPRRLTATELVGEDDQPAQVD